MKLETELLTANIISIVGVLFAGLCGLYSSLIYAWASSNGYDLTFFALLLLVIGGVPFAVGVALSISAYRWAELLREKLKSNRAPQTNSAPKGLEPPPQHLGF